MSSSILMVIRVLPDAVRRTAPRRPCLKLYSFFILHLRTDGAHVPSPFSRRSIVGNPRATCRRQRERAERVHAERDEPILLIRAFIGDSDGLLVMKHRPCVRKVDAMLAQIGGSLARIPYELQRPSVCTAVHIVKRGRRRMLGIALPRKSCWPVVGGDGQENARLGGHRQRHDVAGAVTRRTTSLPFTCI